MPHGTPDWGLVGPKETTYGLDDLGETAVRMGSPHLWDRRGDVVWFTIFQEGPNDILWWDPDASGTFRFQAGLSRQGAYHIQVLCALGPNVRAGVAKELPLPPASRLGFEFSFRRKATQYYTTIMLQYITPVGDGEARVRFNDQWDQLEYYDAVTPWVPFAEDVTLHVSTQIIHVIKLVVDYMTNCYVRIILDNVEYSLANIPVPPGGGAAGPVLRVTAYGESTLAHAVDMRIDSLIVTQNEP